MTDAMTRWSSRKFWTMVAAMALFTALLVLGHLDQNIYAWLAGWTLGSYLAGNVMQHVMAKR